MGKLKLKISKAKMVRKVEGVNVLGYYGRAISNGKVSFDDIARTSAKNTTLHPKEASLAAELLLEGICDQIKQGIIVDLGPLGTLYPAVNGAWKQDPEDLSLEEMKPKVNYKPSSDIDAAIRGASMAWTTEAGNDTNTVSDPANETGTTGTTEGTTPEPPADNGDGELTGD